MQWFLCQMSSVANPWEPLSPETNVNRWKIVFTFSVCPVHPDIWDWSISKTKSLTGMYSICDIRYGWMLAQESMLMYLNSL